jgi:Cdc6-like AAA superfamily ATPase
MENRMTSTIARIYNQFDPAMPLEQGDPRYVSCENSRGSGNLVMQFNNAICWSERVVHLLFSGHRGGGKTTELLRLKNQLENQPDSQKPSFVVYFEADKEDIDVNDASFPDILLAIIRQVGREVRERLNEKLQPSAFKKLLQDVWNLLKSEVEFSSLDFDIGIGSLTATIKNSPDSRKEIRSVLEPKVSNLITAANEFLDEVNILLQKKGYKDLVVIVDNLDRIVLRVIDENTTTHDRLFIDRGPQLHALNCHIIYTLPISIVFTPKAAILSNIFGGQPVVLPMVKVEKPDMSIDKMA